ncbi:MAG: hypothetical protein PHP44_12040 [Kiritimatiellae bacterium]|nr:hypothetical protein [Kiritimatiellia bacterium]MDD4736821.1 hypothetical protein [Kiritimatiellia bacterium]
MTSLAVAFGLSKGGSFNAAAIGGFFNTPGRSGQYDYSVSSRADPGVKALEYLDLLFLIAKPFSNPLLKSYAFTRSTELVRAKPQQRIRCC